MGIVEYVVLGLLGWLVIVLNISKMKLVFGIIN